jgi:alpha-beta hydrolase superfamily lysophospholipase
MPNASTRIPRRAALLGAGMAAAIAAPAAAQEPPIWFGKYEAEKRRNGARIPLAVYRKRMGAPRAGGETLPVLFLVHGSTNAALSSFDLQVPDEDEYSMMNVFARLGYDVWTMDHEGYGDSARTDGNSDVASGVADLQAAADVVTRETGIEDYHMLGESSGALRAGAFAGEDPERVRRLVLAALTYTGKGSPTLGQRAKAAAFYRTHNRRPRDAAMIRSIFTRDRAGTTSPAAIDALIAAEMRYGDTVPSGTYLDMTVNLPVVDPSKIVCPVLIVRGEYDGIAAMDDLFDFFKRIPNGDKQFSVISGAAHAMGMSLNRAAYFDVVKNFLTIPPTIQS